ncbi:hypothetical protein Tco_1535065, partial [Tanacetum coccineum]
VATKSGQVPVNAAKQSSPRAATSISIARLVNTAALKTKVNDALPTTYSYFKAHSLVRRPFNQKPAAKTNNFNKKINTARVNNVTTVEPKAVVSAAVGNGENDVKSSSCWIWRPTGNIIKRLMVDLLHLEEVLKEEKLLEKTECLVLSPDFKLLDESQVLLKVPRHDNMYSFDLNNVVPSGAMNKLVRGNLVRGLPSNLFENDHTCVACQKGKQQKASCETRIMSSISQPLQMLHMDLFGPTSVRSINHKTYWLVVTDDFSKKD